MDDVLFAEESNEAKDPVIKQSSEVQLNLSISELKSNNQSAKDIDNIQGAILEIMREGGALSRYIPGYELRESQLEGVMRLTTTNSKNFILEGPCGYGKSATYLISQILKAILLNKRCIIATAGITLQEQIYNKDIPTIMKAINNVLGVRASYAYLKGRQNFACLRKTSEVEFDLENKVSMDYPEEKSKLIKWINGSSTGDVSELDYIPEYEIWKELSCTDPSDCQGQSCMYNEECFYQKRKEMAKYSKIVICNYHLLFSDIRVRTESDTDILGNYNVLVCDEAHEMAKIARDFQEIKISNYTFQNMQKKLAHLQNKYDRMFEITRCGIDTMLMESQRYFETLTDMFNFRNDDNMRIIKSLEIPYYDFSRAVKDFQSRVAEYREELCPFGDEQDIRFSAEGDNLLVIIKALDRTVGNCDTIIDNLKNVCTQANEKMSYWFEKDKSGFLSLHAKPVKVDEFLRATLFGNSNIETVVTSATLSVADSFDYIKTELGIDEADELIAPSPFDMKNQQLWYLPPNAKDGNTKEFNSQMLQDMIEVVGACQGGCLCLFTSVYNMNLAATNLRKFFPRMRILKQGDAPRNKLLSSFKLDTDSVLVATKSFFTGIDVKGESLRGVIIDKFPFESPNDPVMSVLSNEPNGFFKYMIPDMVIALKQAVGRGIRDINDKCIVAILDNRMATARYKMRIHNSFNYEKTATRNIEDVKQFIQNYLNESRIDSQTRLINLDNEKEAIEVISDKYDFSI